MPLQLVAKPPLQLDLFRLVPAAADNAAAMQDIEREERTGDQWLRSVIAYLNFRAGDSWRSLSYRNQRNSPERWEYLHAIRLIEDVRRKPVVSATPEQWITKAEA